MADIEQIVYVVIAIASFYYPNPDVATSNGIEGQIASNVTIPAELYQQILTVIRDNREL